MDVITNLCRKFYGDKEWLNYKQPQQNIFTAVCQYIQKATWRFERDSQ